MLTGELKNKVDQVWNAFWTESLGQRLFKARVELLGELDKRLAVDGRHAGDMGDGNVALTDERIRQDTAAMLCALVAGMSLDNFVVRARRRWVEAWAQPEAWRCPTIDQLGEVAEQLSGLPSAVRDDDEEKRRTVV